MNTPNIAVRLPHAEKEFAKILGNGSYSEGIRVAIRRAITLQQMDQYLPCQIREALLILPQGVQG